MSPGHKLEKRVAHLTTLCWQRTARPSGHDCVSSHEIDRDAVEACPIRPLLRRHHELARIVEEHPGEKRIDGGNVVENPLARIEPLLHCEDFGSQRDRLRSSTRNEETEESCEPKLPLRS